MGFDTFGWALTGSDRFVGIWAGLDGPGQVCSGLSTGLGRFQTHSLDCDMLGHFDEFVWFGQVFLGFDWFGKDWRDLSRSAQTWPGLHRSDHVLGQL